jgi:6-phosphogluconolactonase
MKRILFWSLLAFLMVPQISCKSEKEILYIGTADMNDSQGLYVYEYERGTNTFTLLQILPEIIAPNFLVLHPSGEFLYCVNDIVGEDGKKLDALSAFAIDDATGKLTLLNQVPSYGRGNCHIELDRTGKFIYVAHYGSGSLSSFNIGADGSIGDTIQTMQFTGSSITSRQQSPHLHAILVEAGNRFAYAADLGTDKVYIFDLDGTAGSLEPAAVPWVEAVPGSGPRHMAFNQKGTMFYLAEELSSTVGVFSISQENGSLTPEQRLPTLPEEFEGQNTVADIHLTPDEKLLFVSNRGHNSLAVFTVLDDGTLEVAGHEPVQGDHPRNFMVDPKGEFVLVANRNTDNINQFELGSDADPLQYTGTTLEVPAAICLKWLILK